MAEKQAVKPNDKLTVEIGGEEVELFMSYKLLNEVFRPFAESEDITTLYIDPELQETILQKILCRKFGNKSKPEELDLEELELDQNTADTILGWAGEHLMDFFLRGANSSKEMLLRHQDRLKKLFPEDPQSSTSSSTGSEA